MVAAKCSVGGKLSLPGLDFDNEQGNNTLTAMAQALKSATSSPRFFRSFQQWTAAWLRYSVPAIACKHLTMVGVQGHMSVVTRICEENRGINPHYVALAVSYDELRRRDWEERAARKDPRQETENEAWVLNKDLLETAKSRLDQVVRAAGLKKGGHDAANASDSKASVAESTLAKQTAAADSAAKRAEIATAKVNATQDSWKW